MDDPNMAATPTTCRGRLKRACQRAVQQTYSTSQLWGFMILMGALAGLAGWLLDTGVQAMGTWRSAAASAAGAGGWLVWVAWTVAGASVATGVCHWAQAPSAEGSGIPQVKSVLAGAPAAVVLSGAALGAKVVGLLFAAGGGLRIGREGPFVFVSAAMCMWLMRLRWFADLWKHPPTRRALLNASVAAGVTAVFGSALGAVIFAVEIMSLYFRVASLWRAFVSAVTTVLVFELLHALRDDELFTETAFPALDVSWQLLSFALCGLCSGLVAPLLVGSLKQAQLFRRALQARGVSRYIIVPVCAVVVGLLTWGQPWLQAPGHTTVNALFASHDAPAQDEALTKAWQAFGMVPALLLFIPAYFLAVLLSVSLPLPCGLFTPVFILGAAQGRLLGEILAWTFPQSDITPAAYAVVGAAGVAAGVTHTLSPAVIVFELTRSLGHAVPVLLGTLIAYSTSALFCPSIYDVLSAFVGAPALPNELPAAVGEMPASAIVHDVHEWAVPFHTTVAQLRETAQRRANVLGSPSASHASNLAVRKLVALPIIYTVEHPVLVGAVRVDALPVPNSAPAQSPNSPEGSATVQWLGLDPALLAAAAQSSPLPRQTIKLSSPPVAPGSAGAGSSAADAPAPALQPPSGTSAPAAPSSVVTFSADAAPLAIASTTPLHRLHVLLGATGSSQVLVTQVGVLQGVIFQDDLNDAKRLSTQRLTLYSTASPMSVWASTPWGASAAGLTLTDAGEAELG